ncbi:MAG: TolB family protein [Bryobacteraceae bacterium]
MRVRIIFRIGRRQSLEAGGSADSPRFLTTDAVLAPSPPEHPPNLAPLDHQPLIHPTPEDAVPGGPTPEVPFRRPMGALERRLAELGLDGGLSDVTHELVSEPAPTIQLPETWQPESAPPRPSHSRRWLAAGVLAAIGLGGWTAYRLLRSDRLGGRDLLDVRRLTPDNGLALDPVIEPSGQLIAYASDRGGGTLSIWIDRQDGADPVRVTSDEAHDSEPDIHPGGEHIAFRSERDGGGIYLLSLKSKDPPKLIAKDGRRPRFSPDGQWIAYYDKSTATAGGAGAKMFVVPSVGGTARQIRKDFQIAQMPVWTPDGKYLVFDGTNPDGLTDWWATRVDDSPPIPTGIMRMVQQAFWSITGPDQVTGNRVFFAASAGDERHVWAVPISPETFKVAGDPEIVTAGSDQFGQLRLGGQDRVAYANSRTAMDVWVAPIDGDEGRVHGDLRRVSKDANYSHLPSVDASGTRVVYLSNRSGVEDLWIADIEGDTETPVTTNLRIAYRPVLSSDATRLILSTVEGKKCSVVVAEILQRREEVALEGCAGIWDWSPDRNYVLFFDPEGVGARASHLMQIPSGRRTEVLWHPTQGIFNARFSPDGKTVAFTAGNSIATAKVFLAPFSGVVIAPTQWVPVADEEGSGPAWAPNGKLVYFRSRRDGFDCIWGRRLEKGKPVGELMPILHLHRPAQGLFRLPESSFIMTVTKQRIILTLARHSGVAWAARLK